MFSFTLLFSFHTHLLYKVVRFTGALEGEEERSRMNIWVIRVNNEAGINHNLSKKYNKQQRDIQNCKREDGDGTFRHLLMRECLFGQNGQFL